jgi:hypothetical protein
MYKRLECKGQSFAYVVNLWYASRVTRGDFGKLKIIEKGPRNGLGNGETESILNNSKSHQVAEGYQRRPTNGRLSFIAFNFYLEIWGLDDTIKIKHSDLRSIAFNRG